MRHRRQRPTIHARQNQSAARRCALLWGSNVIEVLYWWYEKYPRSASRPIPGPIKQLQQSRTADITPDYADIPW